MDHIDAMFSRTANRTAAAAGRWQAFGLAFLLIALWLIGLPFAGFTNANYSLLVNTVTTIVTFLLLFLLQHTQTINDKAMHLKLDELIAAVGQADNRVIEIESADEAAREEVRRQHATISAQAADEKG